MSRIALARAQYRQDFEAVGFKVDVIDRDGLGAETVVYAGVLAWEIDQRETELAQDYLGEVFSLLLLAEDMDPTASAGHRPLDLHKKFIRINDARWSIETVNWTERREAGVTLAYKLICEGAGG